MVGSVELATLLLLGRRVVCCHALSHATQQGVVHLSSVVDLTRIVSSLGEGGVVVPGLREGGVVVPCLREGGGRGRVAAVSISSAVIRREGRVGVEERVGVERLSPARTGSACCKTGHEPFCLLRRKHGLLQIHIYNMVSIIIMASGSHGDVELEFVLSLSHLVWCASDLKDWLLIACWCHDEGVCLTLDTLDVVSLGPNY